MPSRPGLGRRLARSVAYAVAVTLPVGAIAFLVRTQWEPILRIDEDTIVAATAFTRQHPALFQTLVAWEEAFQPRWVYLVGTLVCLWTWRRLHWRGRSLWAFVTMMLAWNLALDVKLLVARARPVVEDALTHAPGYSFPSGHAANTAAAATTLTVLLWPALGRPGRAVAAGVAALVVVATGADRVLLGVHYPSDVVGGMILGVGLTLASYAGWRPPATGAPTVRGSSPAVASARHTAAGATSATPR
ncbi:MAG: phosphatase PAP2 family protein [Dermatophilaceae bacterium]